MTSAVRSNFKEDFGDNYYLPFEDGKNLENITSKTDLFCKFGPEANSAKEYLLKSNIITKDISDLVFDFCDYNKHIHTSGANYPYDKTFLKDVDDDHNKHIFEKVISYG